jgi:hypothetical protein
MLYTYVMYSFSNNYAMTLLKVAILLLHIYWSNSFVPIRPNGATVPSAARTTLTKVAMKSAYATIFSGEPTERAKSLPHRAILSRSVVYSPLTETAISLDTLLPPVTSSESTAIVVFLRSLG